MKKTKVKETKKGLFNEIPEGQLDLFLGDMEVTIKPEFLFEEQKKLPVNALSKLPKKITDLNQLQVGDKIHVYDGHLKREFTGYYITKGFWDGRDKSNFSYYYMEIIDEENPMEYTRNFRGFDKMCQVTLLKENTSYVPPRKEEVSQLLKEKLQAVALDKRIGVYQKFRDNYPSLSYEWSPILRDAWRKAIVEVTDEQDYLNLLVKMNKQMAKKIPEPIKERLESIFNEVAPGERMNQIKRLQWVEPYNSSHDKEIEFTYHTLNENDSTYYKPLTYMFLEKTNNVKLYFEILKHLGFVCRYMMKGDITSIDPVALKGKIRMWHSDERLKSTFVPLWERNAQVAS
ncbi:hypothetical protein [Bacillus cereus group sp. TH152-1LC]|uniref:hypothetical protein n=1 Tax=Bacillus cereus group sp. TH152-1LC TaxID=3018060 RepID=UPI0022E991C3|nr:hypothetical protein [Bacillus cereus group sp. TH152-1LC]MDA1675182.1 hypothetical protein [Bacillus cereus group sp. TH152-1LC]